MNAEEIAARVARARELGTAHGSVPEMPFVEDGADLDGYEPWYPEGYTSYVFWDAGSALLMDALGERGEASDDGVYGARQRMLEAYCEAFAAASGTPWDTSG